MNAAPSEWITVRSHLAQPASTVWAHASTMTGVNAELRPWMQMTAPRGTLLDDPVHFTSWLLALRVVPIDRHDLHIERVVASDEEYGFDERSSSVLHRNWIHRRRVVPLGSSACEVIDQVRATPRVTIVAPIQRRVVRLVFEHRHRRLRRRFGSPGSCTSGATS